MVGYSRNIAEMVFEGKNATELHILTYMGDYSAVKKYLDTADGKKEILAKDDFDETPLHIAADEGYHDVFLLLVYNLDKSSKKAKALIINDDIKNKAGYTPLDLAAKEGNTVFFRKLTEVSNMFNQGFPLELDVSTPLHIFACTNCIKGVESLLQTEKWNKYIGEVDRSQRTPLHIAAEQGHLNMVELLLNNGANPYAEAIYAFTPLHYAVFRNEPAVVEKLLSIAPGAMKTKARDGRTVLHSAIQGPFKEGSSFDIKVLTLLLNTGAQIINEKEDYEGCTALHMAARGSDCLEGVKLLLANGADPTITNQSGETPLHLAAEEGNHEAIPFLIKAGAKIDARDNRGNTPLAKAQAAVAQNAENAEIKTTIELLATYSEQQAARRPAP